MKVNIWPLLLSLAILPWISLLDLKIASFFYHDGFVENRFTYLFYHYGEYPAFFLGAIALLVYITSFFRGKNLRRGALALGLTLFIGSGVLVNGILKECVARPRPKQISQFGGKETFRPVYLPRFVPGQKEEKKKSFPSGHATMGFYFISLIFVGKRYQNLWLYSLGVVCTAILGIGLSLVRMMQGGHFFSDTLASFLIMFYVAYAIDYFIWKRASPLPKEKVLEFGDISR